MKKFKVALQLYSIRDDMAADMDAALAKVKEIGYDYVEFAGYFDKSAEEVKALLDKHGLECISVHQVYDVFLEDAKKNIDFLKTIGAKYCAVPWMAEEKHKGTDSFETTVKEFNQVGRALKDAGIQLLYHNHAFEFKKFEDKFLLDWLYETIDEDILKTQVDTCWVRYAGYDPAEYLRKYDGRSPVVHLKDFVCTKLSNYPLIPFTDDILTHSAEDVGLNLRPVGHGIQDFPAILKAAEEAGAEYVVVEQDSSDDRPALEAAKMSREYLRTLGL